MKVITKNRIYFQSKNETVEPGEEIELTKDQAEALVEGRDYEIVQARKAGKEIQMPEEGEEN